MGTKVDAAINKLGPDLLRELHAICWFCDGSTDGKHALVPSDRRHWYEPGGRHAALTDLGCVRLLRTTKCETVRQYRPALRMEQFGRNVLLRAKAMGLDLEPVEQEQW